MAALMDARLSGLLITEKHASFSDLRYRRLITAASSPRLWREHDDYR